jgi:acetylornithine/N-succinyldiaminopimelate aminotransferase
MQGLEFNVPVAPIIKGCLERGLVLINAGEKILRFVPPLVIEEAHIREMTEILEESIRSVYGK